MCGNWVNGRNKNKQTNKQSEEEKQRKGDAIQCSTYPRMMGGKPRNYHPWAYSEPVKSPLTFTKNIYICASATGGGNMAISYSAGHWEGSPCFPSFLRLSKFRTSSTAQMGEEWALLQPGLYLTLSRRDGCSLGKLQLPSAAGQGHPLQQQFRCFKLFICQGVLFKSTLLMCITAAKGNFL